MRKLLGILFLLCFGCDYAIVEYVDEHTNKVITSQQGDYRAVFKFENTDAVERDLIEDYPGLQKAVNEIVPDSRKFDNITVFVPGSENSWVKVIKLIYSYGNKSVATAFTPVLTEHVYVIFRPEFWQESTNERLTKTAIHELIHHVSLEIYGDVDPGHDRDEFWGKGGFVEQLLKDWKNGQQK